MYKKIVLLWCDSNIRNVIFDMVEYVNNHKSVHFKGEIACLLKKNYTFCYGVYLYIFSLISGSFIRLLWTKPFHLRRILLIAFFAERFSLWLLFAISEFKYSKAVDEFHMKDITFPVNCCIFECSIQGSVWFLFRGEMMDPFFDHCHILKEKIGIEPVIKL